MSEIKPLWMLGREPPADDGALTDTALSCLAVADRIDTTPVGTPRDPMWPLHPASSVIRRLGACADRIRENADDLNDAARQELDEALAALIDATEALEARV